MANQTDARAHLEMQGLAMASLPVLALESTTWYRGQAVGVLLSGPNAGYATDVFDGTQDVLFVGVMKRNITVPASSDPEFARKRQLPLKRDGAVSFNAVTTAGNPATPDATWLWKRVWFVSDNEVSLTPTTGNPVCAGRVIGISGMLGFGEVGSTEVVVAIDDAIFRPSFTEQIDFNVGTLAASGSNQADAIAGAAITKRFTLVTGADNSKGVALPTPKAGQMYIVKVTTAGSTTKVYPQLNGQINALGANNAYTTAQAGAVAFIASNNAQWYSIPLAG